MIPLGLKIAVIVCKGIQLENNVRLKKKLKNEVKSTKPIRLKQAGAELGQAQVQSS